RRTINEVEKLQKEFRKTLGVTFAFLGDEIYLKAGADIPSRRHYGNYPQIEDGVGMVRSFVNAFEQLLVSISKERGRKEAVVIARDFLKNVRTHAEARLPASRIGETALTVGNRPYGTILTGEMF